MRDPLRQNKPVTPAVHWFNRKRSMSMTSEDVRAFEVWLARDPANAAAYRKVEQFWGLLDGLADEPALMEARDEDERKTDSYGRRLSLAAMAASLVLAVAAGWALTNTGLLPGLSWMTAPPQEFRTTIGQRATITLPDRSIVTLDTDTVVRARQTLWERHIELERGQAFFQVAKDKSRPFIVAAAGKTVRATGTAFDVRAEPGRFEVTLIEGRVRVQEQGVQRDDVPVADMRPGWRLAVGEDARWRIEPVDVEKATAWHDGTLSFFDEPVGSAVAEMNRYSRRKIVFRGAPPRKLVLGNFRAGDVEQLVSALEINKLARVAAEDESQIELIAR